mgnify:FL=1
MSTADRIVDNLGDELEEVTENSQNLQGNTQPNNTSNFVVPDKFKDKNLEDIVMSYQNLERDYGRQGQELGELRGLADKLISQTTNTDVSNTPTKADFYDDPESYISQVLEEKLAPIVGRVGDAEQHNTISKWNSEYPQWNDTVNSSEFQQWVSESPIRLDLQIRANQADYTSGKELLGNWEVHKKAIHAEANLANQDRGTRLKNASTEYGNSGQGSSQKIYKRSELMNLRLSDPGRYEAMESDIVTAYAEGRVK